jgi:hypothetical protein
MAPARPDASRRPATFGNILDGRRDLDERVLGSYRVTRSEIDLIHRALQALHKLVPDRETRGRDPTLRPCPVFAFAKHYLVRQPGVDMSTAELWTFYQEVAATGEVEALSRQEFLRALPGAMAMLFGVSKSHTVKREGKTVRGFKSVTIREDAQ